MGFSVQRDDRLDLRVRGVTASEIEFAFALEGRQPITKRIISGTDASAKTGKLRIPRDGVLDWGSSGIVKGAVAGQPGEVFVDAALIRGNVVMGRLIEGYVYGGHSPAFPGALNGALEGRGFRHMVSVASDVTPVDVRQALAVTDVLRKVYGFVWLYDAAAQVASRTLNVRVENPMLTAPTGFGGDVNARLFSLGTVTLTTGEEGMIYVNNEGKGDGIAIINDNGAITTNSTATAPVPFPMTVLEGDPAEILFDVGSAHADDRHSIGIFVEDWIGP